MLEMKEKKMFGSVVGTKRVSRFWDRLGKKRKAEEVFFTRD